MTEKIPIKLVKAPSAKKLNELIILTDEEICELRRRYRTDKSKIVYIKKFIMHSLSRSIKLLLAMSALTQNDLDAILILMRSLLEINVDLFWFYARLLKNENDAEKLAKRFYQIGSHNYLEQSYHYKYWVQKDAHLKNIANKIDPEKFRAMAKAEKIIELVGKNASDELKALQKKDWRALPGFIVKPSQLVFVERAKIATKLVSDLCNNQNAPYQINWEMLNTFTHFTSSQMDNDDDEVSSTFLLRNLDISLGMVHDMLNVAYHYLQLPVPKNIIAARKQFSYINIKRKNITSASTATASSMRSN